MDGMGRYTGGEGKELSGIGVNEARQAGHLACTKHMAGAIDAVDFESQYIVGLTE